MAARNSSPSNVFPPKQHGWFGANRLTVDRKGRGPYTAGQRADIYHMVNEGWVTLDDLKRFTAQQLHSILGNDRFFFNLKTIQDVLRAGQLTPQLISGMLREGYGPTELRQSAEMAVSDFLIAYKTRSPITQRREPSKANLVIADRLREGWNINEIAREGWKERTAPHRAPVIEKEAEFQPQARTEDHDFPFGRSLLMDLKS